MKLLSISLALCAMLTLRQAGHIHAAVPRKLGRCEDIRDHTEPIPGAFIPQCDENGNFLPQQCSGSTGYCWCVNTLTGEEIPNTKTPPGVTPVNCGTSDTSDLVYPCPFGWSYFGGKCFIFHDTPKTWVEAEAYCLFERANLASIHSYEENHFVQALTRTDTNFPETWIGGQDAVQESFWMWSDGSKFNYENWNEEPVPDRNENCVKMNYGLEWHWKQDVCNDTHPFVCSKRI